jgi:hypothetical protein
MGCERFEPNFGVLSLFLCLYKLVVSPVEGPLGGSVVANEETEGLGDAGFLAAELLGQESLALEAESAE